MVRDVLRTIWSFIYRYSGLWLVKALYDIIKFGWQFRDMLGFMLRTGQHKMVSDIVFKGKFDPDSFNFGNTGVDSRVRDGTMESSDTDK